MPTFPPGVPSSLKREPAGTVIETLAKSGKAFSTDGAKPIVTSSVWLTGWRVPGSTSGR